MIEITAEIRAFIDKAAAGVELAEDEYIDPADGLDDVAMDVLYMTGNDHAIEEADPLELAEIKRRWKPYIDQLPEYASLCDELLSRRK